MQYIFQEFGKQAEALLATEPADWRKNPDQGPIEFIYQRNHLLTRTADLGPVIDALNHVGFERVTTKNATSPITGLALISLPPPVNDLLGVLSQVERRLGKPGVVTPNHLISICPATYCPATEPVVPTYLNQQPAVNPAVRYDGHGVKVAVIDTGWAAGAPVQDWMAGVGGEHEPASGNALAKYTGHGLFVASTVRGIAPKADVQVWRVFANGCAAAFEDDLVKDLVDKVLAWNPDIISLSAGTHTWRGHHSLSFRALLDNALAAHPATVLVAAAGNDGQDWKFSPAALATIHPDRVVSVGALSRDGEQVAGFSDRGPWVSVFAPGRDLVQAYVNGSYHYTEALRGSPDALFQDGLARWSGTSFATPVVSGLIASRLCSMRSTPGPAAGATAAWAELQKIAAAEALKVNGTLFPRLRPYEASK